MAGCYGLRSRDGEDCNPTTDEKDKIFVESPCDTNLYRRPLCSVANSSINASNGTATGEDKSDDSSVEDEHPYNNQNDSSGSGEQHDLGAQMEQQEQMELQEQMEQQKQIELQEKMKLQELMEQQKQMKLKTQRHMYYLAAIILAVICILGGVGFYYLYPHADPIDPINPKRLVNGYRKYCTNLDKLKNNFELQSIDFWESVRIVAKPIFDDPEPISPAVTIFVAKTESEFRAARCLSRKVAAAVAEAFGSKPAVTIDGGMKDTPGEVKLRIDKTVTEKLSAGGRVVIVDEVEELHGEAVLMFHSFCHNKNAPFKRAMFIFTMFAGEQANEGVDDVMEKVLKGRWSQHIDRDTIDPLLGSIGNNNVFIKSESDRVLEDNECV